MNVTYLVASYPSGILSDKIGRRSLLVLGYGLYGLVYFGFSFANMNWQFILLFAFYGIHFGRCFMGCVWRGCTVPVWWCYRFICFLGSLAWLKGSMTLRFFRCLGYGKGKSDIQ